MSNIKGQILKNLLSKWPENAVVTSDFLHANGVSSSLAQKYVSSGWLRRIGTGAYIKLQDEPTLLGALYALQNFENKNVHIGGKTALELQGRGHFGRYQYVKYDLFTSEKKLPLWLKNFNFEVKPHLVYCSFLPKHLYVDDVKLENIAVKLSSPERAALEMLYETPKLYQFDEVKLIFENLTGARPNVFQKLLEESTSVKVNRMCLLLAELLQHPWFPFLDISKINLGSGVRSLEKSGVYSKKYQLLYPKVWEEEDVV